MNLSNFSMDTVALPGDLAGKLQAVRRAGFSQVMLWARELANHPGGFDAAVDLVRASGLRVTGLQVIRDYEGLEGSQHEYKVDIAKAMLKMCRAVGAPLLVVCSSTADLPEGREGKIIGDLRKLANLAVPLGIRIGYKAVPWGRCTRTNEDAWDLVLAVNHANFGLVIDSFHLIANKTPLDSLEEIDPQKIALLQLADFSALEVRTPQDTRDTAIHMRVFPGDGVHGTQLAAIIRRIDQIGYRGDIGFLVFNDDYNQLPQEAVLEHARRSAKWVTDQILRRSLPLRSRGLPGQ